MGVLSHLYIYGCLSLVLVPTRPLTSLMTLSYDLTSLGPSLFICQVVALTRPLFFKGIILWVGRKQEGCRGARWMDICTLVVDTSTSGHSLDLCI